MRSLAFAFLVSAAFDWPAWWLDRAGVAAVGFAFLALALPAKPRRRMRLPVRSPAPPVTLDDDGRLDTARLDAIIEQATLR